MSQLHSGPCPICAGQDYEWGELKAKVVKSLMQMDTAPLQSDRVMVRASQGVNGEPNVVSTAPSTEERAYFETAKAKPVRVPVMARRCTRCGNMQLFAVKMLREE